MTLITTPDIEVVLPERIRAALTSTWSGLYVSRSKPKADHPFVVTVTRSGGSALNRVVDQVRVQVGVFVHSTAGVPEQVANQLAETVRAVIEAQRGVFPFYEVRVSVPVPVNSKGEPPQRFFYADVMVRRTTSE